VLVEIEALAGRLRAQLGDDAVITDRAQRRTYECDGLTHHRVVPALVVLADLTDVAGLEKLRLPDLDELTAIAEERFDAEHTMLHDARTRQGEQRRAGAGCLQRPGAR